MEQMMQDVEKGSATASTVLTKEEFVEFSKDFRELKESRHTEVITNKKDGCVEVVLKTDDVSGFLLRASLRDGLLHHWGWDKKFQIEN